MLLLHNLQRIINNIGMISNILHILIILYIRHYFPFLYIMTFFSHLVILGIDINFTRHIRLFV